MVVEDPSVARESLIDQYTDSYWEKRYHSSRFHFSSYDP